VNYLRQSNDQVVVDVSRNEIASNRLQASGSCLNDRAGRKQLSPNGPRREITPDRSNKSGERIVFTGEL
jgi:hypothetical protein